MKKLLSALFLFALFAANGYSQWSSNPAVNLKVCDTTNAQELVKIVPTTDGGCYISWFDTRGGSYAVYLQRLDALGNKLFAPGGLLISGNPQNSSLVDYDMICDDSNNAVIAFTDVRNGGSINPFAYRISPSGTFLWGPNGVNLTDSTAAFQPNPRIAKTTDGNFVIAWRIGSSPQKIAMQKLGPTGTKLWGPNMMIITSGTAENYDWPMITGSDAGSTILMWSGYTGSFLVAANYKIYSQKFSAAGTRVWNATQDTVYSLGHVSGFYNPRIFSDGLNGAVYCWRDDRNSTNLATGYVQRKTSAGAILFPVNGIAVSSNTANNHFDPMASVMSSSGDTYVIFNETNSLQSQFGVYVQRMSPTGTRMLGDGVPVVPLNQNQPSFMYVYTKDTNAICAYSETQFGSTNTFVKAFRIGPSGALSWGGGIVTASTYASAKIRMNAAMNSAGMLMTCWADNRLDANGVYAQNVNYDGTLGNPLGIHPLPGVANTFSLGQNYPNPFNPVTKIKFSLPGASSGSSMQVRLIVYDVLGREVSELINSKLTSGNYEISWDASNVSSGVYFYKLTAGDFTSIKKMSLVK